VEELSKYKQLRWLGHVIYIMWFALFIYSNLPETKLRTQIIELQVCVCVCVFVCTISILNVLQHKYWSAVCAGSPAIIALQETNKLSDFKKVYKKQDRLQI